MRRLFRDLPKIIIFRICDRRAAPPGHQNDSEKRKKRVRLSSRTAKITDSSNKTDATFHRRKTMFSDPPFIFGRKLFLHFSRLRKRRFSGFALVYGPEMPPERDSWRPESPNSIRAEGPFWSPEKRNALGKRLSAKIVLPGMLRFAATFPCVCGEAVAVVGEVSGRRWGTPTPTQHT